MNHPIFPQYALPQSSVFRAYMHLLPVHFISVLSYVQPFTQLTILRFQKNCISQKAIILERFPISISVTVRKASVRNLLIRISVILGYFEIQAF
jgi:hypothetical protein